MNASLRAFLPTLLLILGGITVLLVVTLVVVRATSEAVERRARRKRDELRHLILTALLGEPDEAQPAIATLRAKEGRAWRAVEQQAFAMLPKIKGDSHEALVELLVSRGAAIRAHENARARSLVRRSRGAYQLGALGDRDSLPVLLGLLSSSHFLVRRTSVRALGQIGDPAAVGSLLDAVTADSALVRDVIAALQRIGPSAAGPLRQDLSFLVESEIAGRRGALVANVLGLYGDIASVGVLVGALERARQASLRAASAEALGEISMPTAVPALLRALDSADLDVRVKAAAALGKISDASAVPALAASLGSGERAFDRAIAAALLALGTAGREALATHPSSYAAEALAVHRMRVPA